MTEEEVTIEWSGFSEALSKDLWQFYLSNQFSDVTISTEDGIDMKSHRIILAMCSAYFRDLFKKNPGPNTIVCLSNMRFSVVKKILALMYRGIVEVPASDVQLFIEAAKYLKLQGFENISPSVKVDDIDGEQKGHNREKYSIRLKRIRMPKKSVKVNQFVDDGMRDLSPGTESNQNNEHDKFFPSDNSDDSEEIEVADQHTSHKTEPADNDIIVD